VKIMSAPTNSNTASESPRDQSGVTSVNFAYRVNGRDVELTSSTMLKSQQPKPTIVIPPSHQPGGRTPNQSPA
jgi:hypothetical protein